MEEIKRYLDDEGKVTAWPSKRKLKLKVLEYLSNYFETGIHYSEKEVNNILNEQHTFNDPAILRRELYDNKFLNRTKDCREYWREELDIFPDKAKPHK